QTSANGHHAHGPAHAARQRAAMSWASGKTLTQRLKHGRLTAIEEMFYARRHTTFAATASRRKD
ncbi:hypothetical protein CDC46_26360, partial [Ralstonia solanacearum]|uniref:hypothetical protein n=1 Tax=Ralstonia solanacearum TaxID=305 RepID=UPI001B3B39C0